MKSLLKICILLSLTVLLLTGCASSPEPVGSLPAAESLFGEASPSGDPCSHPRWENGVCTSCGAVCSYHLWDNGVCRTCGTVCEHLFSDSVCEHCGLVCTHEHFDNGTCSLCGLVCSHEAHNPENARCLLCGTQLVHAYDGGVCKCGKTLEFLSDELPEYYFNACRDGGTIEVVSYEAHDYTSGGNPWTKELHVYLPRDYDGSRPCNVLILVHGMEGNQNFWLLDRNSRAAWGTGFAVTKNVIDNMINEGLCKDVIVVAPTFYRNANDFSYYDRYREQRQFMQELRGDILPYIVEHYSTFAQSPDSEGISAAREHFAYAGLSMGSIYAYNTVLPDGQDLFAWYGCFSGSECDVRTVSAALNAPDREQYPIRYFYNAAGTDDYMRYQHHDEYTYLMTHTDKLSEGVNSIFIDHPDIGHEYAGWIMDLYNCLSVFFNA